MLRYQDQVIVSTVVLEEKLGFLVKMSFQIEREKKKYTE
jgi:hypothetical protein